MMNIKNYVENHGKRNIIIFVLIDVKSETRENIVFAIKTKKTDLESTPETKIFD